MSKSPCEKYIYSRQELEGDLKHRLGVLLLACSQASVQLAFLDNEDPPTQG
ncbi:hypothetical protein I79_011399 [Cricetulus griseus]|uniref:Uncharacterized protein n=1 Tax=Cricetulus griseus TaxID=10029 RepID=G3HL14_CRIGR|nr:hypothetical protein I79_011399 [Cricetulus griseus]